MKEELKDLIADEDEEEEESDQERPKRKRKRGKESDYDDRLEDEDYDLLEENLGITLKRVRSLPRGFWSGLWVYQVQFSQSDV